MDQKRQPATFSLLPKIINGGVAGIVGVTCVFPIDLVKTRLQNQRNAPGAIMYRNMFDCAVKTFKREGFFGMYKGSAVNLLLITPEKAIKLVGNDFFRHQLVNKKTGKLTLPREMASGAGAGCLQTIVTTPMELLKIQMQDSGRSAAMKVNSEAVTSAAAAATASGGGVLPGRPGQSGNLRAYSSKAKVSATSIALHLVKEKGLMSLYRGGAATVFRDVSFSIVYFPLFAHLNSLGKRRGDSGDAVFYVSFVSGLTAGAIGSLCVTPIDVVKTRLQVVGTGTSDYTGIRDCFMKVYTQEGPRALMKGGLCRMMVIAPLFGIAQVVYYMGIGEKVISFAQGN